MELIFLYLVIAMVINYKYLIKDESTKKILHKFFYDSALLAITAPVILLKRYFKPDEK